MIKTFLTTLRKNNVRFGGVSLLYLLLAAVIAAASVATFAMTGAIGQEAQAGSTEGIWRLLALLSGIVAVHAVCALVAALVLGRFGGRVGYSFRQNFAKYFLHLPFKKFQEGSSGDRLSVFSNDVPAAVQFITQGGLMFASSIFSLVASFIFMFMTNVTYTLIFYATFPVLMVLQVLLSLPIQKTSKRNQELLGEFNNTVNDSLQNIPTITAYGLEEVMEKRYLEKYENFMKAQRKHGRTFLPLVMFGILASVAPIGIVMVTTATSVINGYMYVGEYIAFLVIAMMSAEWLMMLAQNLNGAQTLRASATRLNEMTPDVGTHTLVRPSSDSISFESVNFTYGEGEEAVQVIKDMSFTITPGSKVAFVGGSGSGKSTVLKLILGLYEPDSGTITAGGGEMFSYVPQDSFMFPESIGKNIACSDNPNMARLKKVCADAGILEFIESLPEGFDTVLTESADNVSGGQRQRIALARAFYKDAPIILFDEATSALDPITEAQVLENFEKMAKGKTVIMVAHRQRAIQSCDTIITLDSGKIVEGGAA